MPFKKGHKPWNKGKKNPGVGGVSKGNIPWNKGKKNPKLNGNKNAFKGEERSKQAFYYEARLKTKNIKKCQRCGSKKDLITHHINEDVSNNRMSNLEKLCRKCHINHHREKLENEKVKKYGNKYGPRCNPRRN